MAYNIEYATTNIVTEYDELVELEQVNIFIDPLKFRYFYLIQN